MKKIAALLLSLLMLATTLAACDGDSDTTSSNAPQSSDVSSVGADSSDDGSTPDVSDESSEEPSVDEFNPEYRTVISTGCSYTSSFEAGEAYEDSYGAELTDGLFAPSESVTYSEVKLSGYAPTSGVVDFVIDLGKEYNNLVGFAGSFLLTNNAGISPPSAVSVKVSVDGREWERVGLLRSSTPFAEGTMGLYKLDTDEYVSARFVKFSVTRSNAWVFLDELMVYADEEAQSLSDVVVSEKIQQLYAEESSDYTQALSQFAAPIAPDRTLSKTSVSSGKHYTVSGVVNKRYPDNGQMLTDGAAADFYESGTWVGFDGTEDVEIVVQLGSQIKDIAHLSLNAYAAKTSNIMLPVSVTYALSNDGKEFTEVGRVYSPTTYSDGAYAFTLELKNGVAARFVKFIVKSVSQDTSMLIDEAQVSAYRKPSAPVSAYYPEPEFPDKGEINYFSPSESDYNTDKNLILGLGQSVVPGTIITTADAQNNTSHTTKWLTDGKVPTSPDIHNADYFKSNGGVKRNIIYDLGASCSVREFSAAFLNRPDWAVNTPDRVSVELSQDGEDWYIAGHITFDKSSGETVLDSKLVLEKPVQARYVRFAYQVRVWTGCAELRVMGKKNADGATLLAQSGFQPCKTVIDGDYQEPDEDLLKGASDISLMYHSQSYNYKEETFMPYLAYYDKDGKPVDVMFDGYLFLLSGKFPSGAPGHEKSLKSDWEWELKQVFGDNINANALNAAAGKAKQLLGLPDDYKYKYYITIYYPTATITNFGDVDGDGVSEDLSVFENRRKVIEWYVDLALQYDKNAAFENIELGGFYWFHEAMSGNDDSLGLLNMTADVVKARDQQLFWIPYYLSSGITEWADYGFATACMQPNYVFRIDTPITNIQNAAAVVKRLGMCIELEISTDCLTKPEYYKRYIEYLKGGVYYGYMEDCIHMYYQEMQIYYDAYKSNDPMTRSIYDYTYQFIKGTLNITPDVAEQVSLDVTADTATIGNIGATDSALSKYEISLSPEHGTVTIAADGSFVYYPDKGYTGSDYFEYRYSDGLDFSESCKVTVNVK